MINVIMILKYEMNTCLSCPKTNSSIMLVLQGQFINRELCLFNILYKATVLGLKLWIHTEVVMKLEI